MSNKQTDKVLTDVASTITSEEIEQVQDTSARVDDVYASDKRGLIVFVVNTQNVKSEPEDLY